MGSESTSYERRRRISEAFSQREIPSLGTLAASEQGPHLHSVVIVGCRDSGRIDATVRVFGGLCYSVNLSDQYWALTFSILLFMTPNAAK